MQNTESRSNSPLAARIKNGANTGLTKHHSEVRRPRVDPVSFQVTIPNASLDSSRQFRNLRVKGAQSDFFALAKSTYMSPAQMNKTKGFVSFDRQQFRPAMRTNNVHERRFETWDRYPKIASFSKKQVEVDFEKMLPRDGQIYRGVQASDSCFEYSQLSHTRKATQNIPNGFACVSGGPPKNWIKEAMLPQYERDPSRYTKNAFSLPLSGKAPGRIADYQGN